MSAEVKRQAQSFDLTQTVLAEMIGYLAGDVRRINHALKVYAFADLIASEEPVDEETRQIIRLSAILHDIGIHEAERVHGSSAGNWQELEGPPVARAILEAIPGTESYIGRVCYLVGHHHTWSLIDAIDFRILVEADFLVNIFEDAMGAQAIESVAQTIFRTAAGKRLLESLYPTVSRPSS
jgi:HD superfamily phosphodiesterase